MKMDKYVNSVSNLFVSNRLLKFVVVVLAAMQLMNYVAAQEADENRRTVIIPMGLSETVEVSAKSADETYLSAMGIYITQLLYSTTPTTVESQYRILSSLFSPEAYKDIANDYLLSATSQAKNQVTQNMKITSVINRTEPEIYLEIAFVLERYIFAERIDEPKATKLRIDYMINNGKFTITGLSEEQ